LDCQISKCMYNIIITFNRFFDWLWYSSSDAGNYFHIIIYSLVSAFVFLLIFKKVSNQEKIRHHKKKIVGYILQMRLYQDKPVVIFSSIIKILKHNLLYIQYTLSSLLVIIIPLLIISTQINNRCGYAPLNAGQQFIVEAQLDHTLVPEKALSKLGSAFCTASPDLEIETMPLRIPKENKVLWRGRVDPAAKTNKEYIKIGFRENDNFIIKKVVTASGEKRFSPDLAKWSLNAGLVSNAEGFLAKDSPVSKISINYKRASYSFLFWKVDALLLYFILTFTFAFALKPFFRVSI